MSWKMGVRIYPPTLHIDDFSVECYLVDTTMNILFDFEITNHTYLPEMLYVKKYSQFLCYDQDIQSNI